MKFCIDCKNFREPGDCIIKPYEWRDMVRGEYHKEYRRAADFRMHSAKMDLCGYKAKFFEPK